MYENLILICNVLMSLMAVLIAFVLPGTESSEEEEEGMEFLLQSDTSQGPQTTTDVHVGSLSLLL